MTARKRLTRSRTDWIVSGLCGGLGTFLGVQPIFVRGVLAALVLFSGLLWVGALLYLVLWVVVAAVGSSAASRDETAREGIHEMGERVKDAVSAAKTTGSRRSRRWVIGLVATVAGLVMLGNEMGIGLFAWLDSGLRAPLAILVVGILMMSGRGNGSGEASAASEGEAGNEEGDGATEDEGEPSDEDE